MMGILIINRMELYCKRTEEKKEEEEEIKDIK